MNHKIFTRSVWLIFALFLLTLLPLHTLAYQPDAYQASVDPAVEAQIEANDEATFWTVMREQANLQPAYQIADWDLRGRFVVDRLQEVATRTQAGLIADLRSLGAAYRPIWIINAEIGTAGPG